MGKVLKSVAKIAIPVAASFIPGIGPLGLAAAGAVGGAVGGGGLKGALTGAALSGLGGALFGAAPGATGIGAIDSLNSGLFNAASPLRSLAGGLFESIGGASSAASSGSTLPWLKGGADAASSASRLPWLKGVSGGSLMPNAYVGDAAYMTGAGSASSGSSGILERLGNIIKNPSMNDISSALALYNSTQDQTPPGMLTQQQIMDQMNADRAKQQASNEKFISSLNSSPLQRTQTNPAIDYYSYGTKPETSFFDNVAGNSIKFAKGGMAQNLNGMGGQDDTVDAKLSHGEYVLSADVVSSLGDGNTDAGAKALDQMVKKIRKIKAPAMKKGVLPPRAKSPLAYLGKAA